MIINKSDEILIAREALFLYENYITTGICASLIKASEHYGLLNPVSYEEEKEFLEENFSVIKEISVTVTNCIEEANLIYQPDFLIDKFWWGILIIE